MEMEMEELPHVEKEKEKSKEINYICDHCHNLLATFDGVVKFYYQKRGRPYLFTKVENVSIGQNTERSTSTGVHIIADLFCLECGTNVGYKIESTKNDFAKCKTGKFVLKRYIALGPDERTNTMTNIIDIFYHPRLYG